MQQHPVGMTFQYKGGTNKALFNSPADWISPNPDGGYKDDPPINDGRKVVLNDTDHLWGIGGNSAWVWKSFLPGHNPPSMDPFDGTVLGQALDSQFEPTRRSLGHTLSSLLRGSTWAVVVLTAATVGEQLVLLWLRGVFDPNPTPTRGRRGEC